MYKHMFAGGNFKIMMNAWIAKKVERLIKFVAREMFLLSKLIPGDNNMCSIVIP